MEASSDTKRLCLCLVLFFSSLHLTECMNVTYDRKALIIRGQRRILFSGSIHYPRSTPQMWEGLIQKAKDGGLDAIDTYVFWDVHEPSPGSYNFEGRYDLVRFIKLVQKAGLFVHLRIGPYICGEWNFGGFPVWLKFVPGIAFRTNNEPFKAAMEKFTQKIVQMMKDEKLFESQGGPIIISQIENEYWPEEGRFGKAGKEYMLWAASMAVAMDTGVPWVMCKQDDAPDPVINTCNGFYCNKFSPNKPYKPTMWTEAWTGWFDDFGGPVHTRPVEDLAVAVARFIQKGGSFVNYYMYHGGTNFGRSAGGPFITTSYDYDAPIDEYGLIRQPKYGHLQDLHKAVKLCEKVLVSADPNITILGHGQSAYVYTSRSGCVAFLENQDRNSSATVKFNGMIYDLPRWSISILPDCKTTAYNTAKVRVQPSRVEMVPTNTTIHSLKTFNEQVSAINDVEKIADVGLLDQLNVTRDDSDYLWYTITIDISPTESFLHTGELPVLSAESAGDGMYVYINGHFSGWAYGSQQSAKFKFSGNVNLKAGKNTIALLSFLMGLPNNGPHYEQRSTGILGPVFLSGLNGGSKDLTHQNWSYKIGPKEEFTDLATSSTFSPKGWTKRSSMVRKLQPWTWYKGYFDAPKGDDPLALDMLGMGKGQVWVNGNNIGRYWNIVANGNCSACDYSGSFRQNKCHIGCGHPTQKWYHLPRSWLKPTGNSLVVFEEIGGDASKIYILKRLVRND